MKSTFVYLVASFVFKCAFGGGTSVAAVPECPLNQTQIDAGVELDETKSGVSIQPTGTLVRCYFNSSYFNHFGQLDFNAHCPLNKPLRFPGFAFEPASKEINSGSLPNTIQLQQQIVIILGKSLSDGTGASVIGIKSYSEIKTLRITVFAYCAP